MVRTYVCIGMRDKRTGRNPCWGGDGFRGLGPDSGVVGMWTLDSGCTMVIMVRPSLAGGGETRTNPPTWLIETAYRPIFFSPQPPYSRQRHLFFVSVTESRMLRGPHRHIADDHNQQRWSNRRISPIASRRTRRSSSLPEVCHRHPGSKRRKCSEWNYADHRARAQPHGLCLCEPRQACPDSSPIAGCESGL